MSFDVLAAEEWASQEARREETADAATAGFLARHWPWLALVVVVLLAAPGAMEVASGDRRWSSLVPPILIAALLIRIGIRGAARRRELLAEPPPSSLPREPPRDAHAAALRAVADASGRRQARAEAIKSLRKAGPHLSLGAAKRLVENAMEERP